MYKTTLKILQLIFLLFFPLLLSAETIVLNSGKIIEGAIVERTDEYIRVERGAIPLTYFLSDIESIDGIVVAIANNTDTISIEERRDSKIPPILSQEEIDHIMRYMFQMDRFTRKAIDKKKEHHQAFFRAKKKKLEEVIETYSSALEEIESIIPPSGFEIFHIKAKQVIYYSLLAWQARRDESQEKFEEYQAFATQLKEQGIVESQRVLDELGISAEAISSVDSEAVDVFLESTQNQLHNEQTEVSGHDHARQQDSSDKLIDLMIFLMLVVSAVLTIVMSKGLPISVNWLPIILIGWSIVFALRYFFDYELSWGGSIFVTCIIILICFFFKKKTPPS